MLPVDSQNLNGAQKAAILLLMLGEKQAAKLFKDLDEDSIAKVGAYMSEISYVPGDVLNSVANEFIDYFENKEDLLVRGREVLEKVLKSSLDEETVREVLRIIEKKKNEDSLKDIVYIPSETLLSVIKNEHPQTLALILSQLPPDKAGEILSLLADDVKSDVALRMVKMFQVSSDVIEELKDAIKNDIAKLGGGSTKRFDGVERLGAILNVVDRTTGERILSFIEQEDSDLADRIRQKMFVFEDLLGIDDRGFRELLQNVDNQLLAKALKTASEELIQKVFANLSSRAGEMLREDMEVMGPVRLSSVEEAQQAMIKTAKRLEAEGKIVIGGEGKDDVLV
jgi:flagellar motor switch protein FliG